MKATLTGILRALALSSCALWLTGCETEAEDAAATNVPPAAVAATNSSAQAATNPPPATSNVLVAANTAPASTNAAPAGTNSAATVTNEQTVIVNKVEPTLPSGLKLSKGVEEVVKLAQSGVSETVMLLFVEKSPSSFDLDAAEILYLNDLGIPQTVIASMLNHDGATLDLNSVLSSNETAVATAPPPPANTPAPQQVAEAAPALPPQPVQVTSNYVADPNYQAPMAQQPVVVQQQPVVVQQPVIVQQPVVVQPAVTHSFFYSSLAPYGTWVEVADYGWCWQPTIAVVHRGWRPYAHGGRWLYSDHGWYWHSDYSWGWAPFHYGRWHVAGRHGWVWVPDYTWGPSWVTWRYSGSYCGWAPLPPRCDVRPGFGFRYWDRDVGFSFSFGYSHEHYTFVPTRHFHHRRPIDHVVPTEKTVNIYKDSTVVNNYIVGNNNTIVNNGVSRDRIVSHTRTEIPRVRIQEAPTPVPPGTPGATIQPDRIHKRGQEMVVYRPKTPPVPSASLAQPLASRGSLESRRPAAPAALGSSSGNAASPQTGPRIGQETRRPNTVSPASVDLPAGSRIAARKSAADTVAPTPAAPPPIRPEAAPAFTPSVRSSRAVQEASRPGAPLAGTPASTPGQVISPRPSSRFGNTDSTAPLQPQSSRPTVGGGSGPIVRPSTPVANGRFGAEPSRSPALSGAVPGGTPSTVTAPSAQVQPVTPAQNSRFGSQMPPSISSTPSSVRPDMAPRPVTPSQNSRFGSQPAMPPSISGQAVPGSNPGSVSSRPATTPQASRFGATAPSAPPSVSGMDVPGSRLRSESRFDSTPSRQSAPAFTPQPSAPVVAPQQPRTSVTPGGIQGGSRFGTPAPAPTAPATVLNPRSESFNRSTAPSYQPAPPPVARPQSVTPVNPRTMGPSPAPSFQGNPRIGAPQINSAPISGNSRFGSAPPAAAPAPVQIRPSAPPASAQAPAQTPQGRGRIEIGR